MSSDTLYVFGDQSLDLLPSIQQLSRQCRQNHPLARFMRTATDHIQHAVSTTPAHLRPDVSPFDSPLQLAEVVGNASGSTPLISSLLAIAQLGDFIVHLSSNPCALDDSQSSSAFLSICTGSLPAAAIASCRNLTELLRIAPHIVSLAFHVGLEAFRRSQSLDRSGGTWATVLKDVDPTCLQPMLDTFNQDLDNHSHQRVYISAVGESCVTVSGPPSITKKFFDETPSLETTRRLELPIKAAFHARHLIPASHSRIFQHVSKKDFRRILQHSVISPCSGGCYASQRLDDVLHEIVDEILQQPIDWRTTTKNLPNALRPTACAIAIGPLLATGSLSKWFASQQETRAEARNSDQTVKDVREGSGAVAIVGMSIRAPGSETLEDFWNVLKEGRDLHQEIPSDRFDIKTRCDPSGRAKNTTSAPYGVFIDRPGYFDPRFFNMSPREAFQTDPQQRLVLLTTYEALENAGYSPNRTPSSNTRRIASFIGQTGDDYREFNANQDVDTYFITGNIRAFGPGRVNYHFGWEGPSFSIDTACSSSGASIQLACSALLSRECDTAVSGGANLLTSPDLFAGLSRGGFLSKTGGCKTFDQDADGYVRGEACGVIVLKRLEDAIADRDNVLAVIRGAATNHSAEAVSITHPHEKTQERLFKTVLNGAGVLPHEVDVAEIHGTGTQAGDAIESRSVTNVLCQGRSSENPLVLSTVKPSFGHGEAASGVTSIIKAVLMMQKNVIPPHTGIKSLINDKLPRLEDVYACVLPNETPFHPRAGGDGKRRILVNNFDAAGGNTSMLLEDPPQLELAGHDHRSHKVVAFSAKSASALANNICSMVCWLKTNPDARIEDIAYTTTSRRMHHPHRKAYAAASVAELITVLEKLNPCESVRRPLAVPSVVFCFTGQGSQYISMASVLYKTHSAFRELIDAYAEISDSHHFPSFLPVLEGDLMALESPVQTQISIIAIELALSLLWNSWGVKASAVVGHSLGEYAALCYAGVISPSDCLYLVGKRAQLIADKCTPDTHAMLAVQASWKTIQEHVGDLTTGGVEFACFNSPKSTVISGPLEETQQLQGSLNLKGLGTRLLPTRHAFHSSQLDTVLDDFEAITRKIPFSKPTVPVASTMLGEIVTVTGVFGPQYLRSQTRNSVRFQDSIEALHSASIVNEATVWVEVGPAPNCLSMIKATTPGARTTLASLQNCRSDWQVLASSVASAYNAGLNINWNEFHRPFEQSIQLIQLPNYNFDLKNYWMYEGHESPTKGSQLTTTSPKMLLKPNTHFSPSDGLHRIEWEVIDSEKVQVTFATDASHPNFNKALRGHMVNGVALCPSSVYADMAFAAASYVRELYESEPGQCIEVDDMAVTKPLIINQGVTNQVIVLIATKEHSSHEVRLEYSSRDESAHQVHATCVARLQNNKHTTSEWSKNAYLILSRINHLHQASIVGKAHKILRSMVYKLFRTFVDYDAEYQGLEEVYLDTDMLEAAANVSFRSDGGKFVCSPYWIDSIAHLSGFILNGTEFTPADSVFISHGWKSLKVMEPLSMNKSYQSYVRMQPSTRQSILTGDVYLFKGDRLVAICQDLKFQQIRRNVLDHILPSAKATPVRSQGQRSQQPTSSPSKSELSCGFAPKFGPTPGAEAVPTNSTFEQILNIIASELGTEVSEIEDEAELTHLGVDSLMCTRIATHIAVQTDVYIAASVMIECRTIRELRACFDRSQDAPLGSIQEWAERSAAREETVFASKETNTLVTDAFLPILKTIARELRVEVSELEDDALFADLGVDSLLTISLLSSLSELVGKQLPASLLNEYPTIADLRQYFQPAFQDRRSNMVEPASNDCHVTDGFESMGQITPATEFGDYNNESCLAERSITTEILRKIVAEEVGISTTEIENDALLVEMGVDSLLSLSILAKVKHQTGLILASNFLFDNPTFSAIERALTGTPTPQPGGSIPTESMPAASVSSALAPRLSGTAATTCPATVVADTRTWGASSILLQGSSLGPGPCLFLIPDGSGSPSSYIGLPYLDHTGAVFGLNSPFLADSSSFTMSLDDLVELYVTEILRVQPEGPYHVGGWSIGGICAFEAAAQLIRKHGQEISSLVLIDAPCPTVLPPLPIEDVDFLQSIGALETLRPNSKTAGGAPVTSTALCLRDGVREHFVGSLNALEQYTPSPIDRSKAPGNVVVLWARHGVWETLGEEMGSFTASASTKKQRHPTTSWLMDSRPSFEACGWEELLPGSNFTCHTVQGDHFSIMRKPGVLEMGAKIRSSIT